MSDTSNHLTIEELADELRSRLDKQKRAIVAGLDREHSLRDEKATLRDSLKSAEHSADRWQSRAESAEARVEELTTENARLEKELSTTGEDSEHRFMEMKRLTEERDDLRWQRNDLEDRLVRMAEENARLKQEAQADGMRIAMLKQGRDTLRAEVERLQEELDNAGQREPTDAWYKISSHPFFSDCFVDGVLLDEMLAKLDATHARTAVPRVIEPSKLREGQSIAAYIPWLDEWNICEVYEDQREERPTMLESYDWQFRPTEETTLVLLSDAPEDADDDDDSPCCRIKQTGICEDIG